MLGKIGPWEIIAIKLPELARAVGKSVVELKEGLKGGSGSDESAGSGSEPKK